MSFFCVVTTERSAIGLADRRIFSPHGNFHAEGARKIFLLSDRLAVCGIGTVKFSDALGTLKLAGGGWQKSLQRIYEDDVDAQIYRAVCMAVVLGLDPDLKPFTMTMHDPRYDQIVVREPYSTVLPPAVDDGEINKLKREFQEEVPARLRALAGEGARISAAKSMMIGLALAISRLNPHIGDFYDLVTIGEEGAVFDEW